MTRLTTHKCIEGWTNCINQLRIKADVVFIGDSLTYNAKLADVFPDYTVANLGLRGDAVQGVIDRIEQIKALRPSKLFIMIGLNDVGSTPVDDFYLKYSVLVERLLSFMGKGEIYLQSILPVNSINYNISCDYRQVAVYNSVIQRIATEKQIAFINLYELYSSGDCLLPYYTNDGIHLKDDAYTLWYDTLKTILNG